ncbi:hypothetical protein BIV57_04700 [Mangrovactinospora gilvigrisea]|uniref:Alpha/beta hydrolase n=1 Tax=Mangrovactinospora gilvigrisea TaxID=1428644 RepID=A0A1J7BYL4_9ACTN|nr:hypothetical protein [Mangrovactinospora gilvigrisea]OIV38561.1 hypothetical protein BIV57_04700 [Mangrovactinospora gilvigrisea]
MLLLLVPRRRRRRAWPLGPLEERLTRSARAAGAAVRRVEVGPSDAPAAVSAALGAALGGVADGVPVVLIGAGASARPALWAAGHPAVRGVGLVGLRLPAAGPSGEEAETVDQLAGRRLLMVDGGRDPWADPELGYRFAVRALDAADEVVRFEVHGGRNPLRARAEDVRELVTDWALAVAVDAAPARALADAAAIPGTAGLRMPLQDGFTSRH